MFSINTETSSVSSTEDFIESKREMKQCTSLRGSDKIFKDRSVLHGEKQKITQQSVLDNSTLLDNVQLERAASSTKLSMKEIVSTTVHLDNVNTDQNYQRVPKDGLSRQSPKDVKNIQKKKKGKKFWAPKKKKKKKKKS